MVTDIIYPKPSNIPRIAVNKFASFSVYQCFSYLGQEIGYYDGDENAY
jgi:hypothetical protein